jgi:hypothetical protein
VFIITDNPRLALNIDPDPLVIPQNGPLTALIAVLPLQVHVRLIIQSSLIISSLMHSLSATS